MCFFQSLFQLSSSRRGRRSRRRNLLRARPIFQRSHRYFSSSSGREPRPFKVEITDHQSTEMRPVRDAGATEARR